MATPSQLFCSSFPLGPWQAELNKRERWLLILDNADDPAAFRGQRYCAPPPTARGHVLITTRANPDDYDHADAFEGLGVTAVGGGVAGGVAAGSLKMELLPVEDGVEMLRRGARRQPKQSKQKQAEHQQVAKTSNGDDGAGEAAHPNQESDEEGADDEEDAGDEEEEAIKWLAGRDGLNGLALALKQAAAYVRAGNAATYVEYKQLYLEERTRVFETTRTKTRKPSGKGGSSSKQDDDVSAERRTITTTWNLSVAKLSPAAKELLEVRYLHPFLCVSLALLHALSLYVSLSLYLSPPPPPSLPLFYLYLSFSLYFYSLAPHCS